MISKGSREFWSLAISFMGSFLSSGCSMSHVPFCVCEYMCEYVSAWTCIHGGKVGESSAPSVPRCLVICQNSCGGLK